MKFEPESSGYKKQPDWYRTCICAASLVRNFFSSDEIQRDLWNNNSRNLASLTSRYLFGFIKTFCETLIKLCNYLQTMGVCTTKCTIKHPFIQHSLENWKWWAANGLQQVCTSQFNVKFPNRLSTKHHHFSCSQWPCVRPSVHNNTAQDERLIEEPKSIN